MRGHRLDFLHDGGGVQQRLRGDAADEEADAERRIALHQHRGHAEIGGAERRRIAARSGAEHQHVAFDIGVGCLRRQPGRRGGAVADPRAAAARPEQRRRPRSPMSRSGCRH